MKHDYVHFSIPAPIIKDAGGSVEDEAGSLRVTYQLQTALLGDIEGLQEIARRLRDQPGTIDPQAHEGRIEALWALAQTIDERLKADIILLDAVSDKLNA